MKQTYSPKTIAAIALSGLMLAITGCNSVPMPMLSQNGSPIGVFNSARHQSTLKASQFSRQQAIPGEIIVRFKPGVSANSAQSTLQALNLSTIQRVGTPHLGLQVVKVANGASIAQTLQNLNRHPAIAYAEPNGIMSINPVDAQPLLGRMSDEPSFPNDEMFGQQYAHKVTKSQEGWAIQKGNPDFVVAIVDTGVDLKHPDLAEKMVAGYDFVDSDEDATDEQGHGTHCAGITAALTNNKVGVAGYAPNAKIMPVRVLDARGSGTWADVANGIIWAADNGAKVISLSLGGSSNSQVVGDAVKHALSKDAVVIAASGNGGNNTKSYPAAYPGVMAIGATDSRDKIARFSQYGEWLSVSAPGVQILSTFPTYSSGMPGTKFGSISGTSMATPAVAGLAALVRSQFPELTQEQVKAHIQATADDLGDSGFDLYHGHGRINVAKALGTSPAMTLNRQPQPAFAAQPIAAQAFHSFRR